MGYQNKRGKAFFNKRRYIGVVARESFFVLDLYKMDIVALDTTAGYVSHM